MTHRNWDDEPEPLVQLGLLLFCFALILVSIL